MISFLSTIVMAGWFLWPWNPAGTPESTNTLESNWIGLETGVARGTEEANGEAKLLWAGRGARGAMGLRGATLVWDTGNTGGSS